MVPDPLHGNNCIHGNTQGNLVAKNGWFLIPTFIGHFDFFNTYDAAKRKCKKCQPVSNYIMHDAAYSWNNSMSTLLIKQYRRTMKI